MSAAQARAVAGGVPDPELPMVTIADLGILRDVEVSDGAVTVTITPTYSGCPAMREIAADVSARLHAAGHTEVTVRTRLAPAWSTDDITAAGRAKLAAAGVAPPGRAPRRTGPVPLTLHLAPPTVRCPRCGSADTVETARFGTTACTALRRCRACAEPFSHMKEF